MFQLESSKSTASQPSSQTSEHFHRAGSVLTARPAAGLSAQIRVELHEMTTVDAMVDALRGALAGVGSGEAFAGCLLHSLDSPQWLMVAMTPATPEASVVSKAYTCRRPATSTTSIRPSAHRDRHGS